MCATWYGQTNGFVEVLLWGLSTLTFAEGDSGIKLFKGILVQKVVKSE